MNTITNAMPAPLSLEKIHSPEVVANHKAAVQAHYAAQRAEEQRQVDEKAKARASITSATAATNKYVFQYIY